jgi:hypothetical protein
MVSQNRNNFSLRVIDDTAKKVPIRNIYEKYKYQIILPGK